MTVGFRVGQREGSIDASVIDRARHIPVANVSDSMWRMAAGGHAIRPMGRAARMAGPALVVRTAPGDNLMVHKAIDIALPGDIIVVDAGGDLTNAIIGEHMLGHALNKGVAGFVINGAVRDLAFIESASIPVFAAGITHRGPYKNGPGEVHYAIAIGGMVIESGDLILGDEDGFLAVPARDVEEVLAKAEQKSAAEHRKQAAIDAGSDDRTWIDTALRKAGCTFAEE